MVDTSYVWRRATRQRALVVDGEIAAVVALLGVALAIGLATAGHYGLSVDEFNTDDCGPKALAWYTSGFSDRSHFETVEQYLWLYGPWFQMLTAFVQSLGLGDPIAVRHAMTFAFGLAGLAAVVPIARQVIGAWAGFVALTLCLLTGYVWGNLFFATIDTPFLFAMSWSTYFIIRMARGDVPGWGATVMAGLFTGLALTTRTGGIITHAYLLGAMTLSLAALVLRRDPARRPLAASIALRSVAVMAIAWLVAIALWPWLQLANPFAQFAEAYLHFTRLGTSFEFLNWGAKTVTDDLPWWYIPGQLLVRLPEAFLALLVVGIGWGMAAAFAWTRSATAGWRRRGLPGLREPALALARARASLVVAVAAFVPLAVMIAQQSTMYDGIRHVLFTLPMLALVAAFGLQRILPLLRRMPVVAGTVSAAYAAALAATLTILHPLEYTAMNALAGGVAGAEGRFERDYWSMAIPEAVQRLKRRLDGPAYARFAQTRFAHAPPRVLVCIGWREHLAGPLIPPNWILETEPAKADFLLATERWPCAKDTGAVLIDEVQRFGTSFAWIYANNRGNSEAIKREKSE